MDVKFEPHTVVSVYRRDGSLVQSQFYFRLGNHVKNSKLVQQGDFKRKWTSVSDKSMLAAEQVQE